MKTARQSLAPAQYQMRTLRQPFKPKETANYSTFDSPFDESKSDTKSPPSTQGHQFHSFSADEDELKQDPISHEDSASELDLESNLAQSETPPKDTLSVAQTMCAVMNVTAAAAFVGFVVSFCTVGAVCPSPSGGVALSSTNPQTSHPCGRNYMIGMSGGAAVLSFTVAVGCALKVKFNSWRANKSNVSSSDV